MKRAKGTALQPATSNQQPATSNQQPATSNQQPATSMNDVLYISREQELLACLRDAQFAAAVGNIDGVLRMQAKTYAVLSEIAGEQTQQVLRLCYMPRQNI